MLSGDFNLGDEGEINNNKIFKDSNEIAKVIEKLLDKYDDHLSISVKGNFYRYFGNFKRVSKSEHGRCANEFNNFLNMRV